MATKRKREDNSEVNSPYGLRKLLSSAITSDASAEVALLHIMMEEHNFRPSLLAFLTYNTRKLLLFVGLDPIRNMNDIATFELYRSRIPTSLFRSIVQDMDVLLHQYGPPIEHETEEATSRFLAPVRRTLLLRRNSDCCSPDL
jgi:hypothetical protein